MSGWATVCTATATSLSTYGAAGCSLGGVTFSNFSVGTTTNTIVGPLNTVTPGPNTVVLPDGTTITAAAAGGGLDMTTGSPLPPCTTGSFCVTGKNQSLTSTITYEVATNNPNATINLAVLFGTLHSHANTTSAAIYMEICPGGVAFSQGCSGYQVTQLGTINGANISITNGTTSLSFGATNTLWIRNTVYLTTNNGAGSDAEVTDFGMSDFAVTTPEPATYAMVGLALAGLGLIKFRRKRR